MSVRSRRADILAVYMARLQVISIQNGFHTDTGSMVLLNENTQLGDEDPDQAIAIAIGDDEVRTQGKKLLIALPISILAIAKADLEEPWVAVEAAISDIKRAMELEDRTLGGLVEQSIQRGATRTLPREPGSMTVGASILYPAYYSEQWGNP